MSRTLMADAFAHHTWGTTQLIDTCLALSPEQPQVVERLRPLLELVLPVHGAPTDRAALERALS